MQQPIGVVKEIFGPLKWTQHKVAVHDATPDKDFKELQVLFKLIDPDIDDSFPPKATPLLEKFVNQYCRKRQYKFQV